MTDTADNFDTQALFPTHVHFRDIPGADAMNAAMLARIRALQAEDPKGLSMSNERALGGWHSANDLHRDPTFEALRNALGETMGRVAASLRLASESRLALTEMWSIVNPPRSFNREHLHPNNHFSGVYYVQAPEDCGNLILIDPRVESFMLPLQRAPEAAQAPAFLAAVPVKPKPGRLVVFPSWLRHRVEPNMTAQTGEAGERVIVSFNLRQRIPT